MLHRFGRIRFISECVRSTRCSLIPLSALALLTCCSPTVLAADPERRTFPPPVLRDVIPAPAAQAPPGLSLGELEQIALQNNPTLASAQAQVTAARGRQVQAGVYPNPTVGYIAQDIGEDHTAGEQGAFISQQFITGHKRQLDQAVAGQDIQERKSLADAQTTRVLSDVRLRFYDALVTQRKVELSDELVKITRQSADLSQRLLQAQQVSQSDLLQAQIEASEAAIFADNARNDQTQAWRRLTAVIGSPNLDSRPLAGDLESNIPNYD